MHKMESCCVILYFCVLFTAAGGSSLTLKRYKEIKQMISNKSSIPNMGNAQSILRCARECTTHGECEGLVYNEIDGLCELVKENIIANFSLINMENLYEVTSRKKRDCGEWKKALTVNSTGAITFGDILVLKNDILSGVPVRIGIERLSSNDNESSVTVLSANSVFVSGNLMCCQGDEYISFSNTNLQFISYLICTDGLVHAAKRFTGTKGTIIKSLDVVTSSWFLRKTACLQTIYNADQKYRSSIYDKLYSVQAFTVAVVQTSDMGTKVHYRTQTNLPPFGKHATITSHGELSKVLINSSITYAENLYWVTTTFNFTENIEEMLCNVNGNKTCEVQVSSINQRSYVDGNWEKVLHHTSSGKVVSGAFMKLSNELLNGNRVLVYSNGEVKEPDVVVVDDDNVTAFFSLFPVRKPLTNKTLVVWEMLSTSGRYEYVAFHIDTGDFIIRTNGSRECVWFVENAVWTRVHDGSDANISKLVASIESGLRIRLKSNCLSENTSSSSFFTCLHEMEATRDNKYFVKSRTGMLPGISYDTNGLHLAAVERPIWMSLMLTIQDTGSASLRRSRWIHENSYFDETVHLDSTLANENVFAN